MARAIETKLRIRGQLEAITPLHVGGHHNPERSDTDMPLAYNGLGEPYIPGTSIAGALKNWCEKAFSKEETQEIWGFQPEKTQQNNLEALGCASFVIIEDANIALVKGGYIEIRDGVKIEPSKAVAEKQAKYDRAILPKNSLIKLDMAVDIPSSKKSWKAIIGHLLTALENQEIRLGAGKTRGLGRICLRDLIISEETRNTPTGILAVLKKQSPNVTIEELKQTDSSIKPKPQTIINIKVKWKPISPLMVKAGYEGIAVDMLPLTSSVSEKVALVLPGSSIKGAFRSQAKRIITTLQQNDNSTDNNVIDEEFSSQIKLPLILELFGSSGDIKKDEQKRENSKLGLGAFSVDDCYSTPIASLSQWEKIKLVKEVKDLQTELAKLENSKFTQSFHVAIDRWTGAASEGALYSVLEPHKLNWQEMFFSLDFNRLPCQLHKVSLFLLFLLFRDLMQKRIPLGFATNRGMGEIEVIEINLQANSLPEGLSELSSICITKPDFSEIPSSLRQDLTNAWKEWVSKNRNGDK